MSYGIMRTSKGAPWLNNKGDHIARLDQQISTAKWADQHATRFGTDAEQRQARRILQTCRKTKAHALKTWEVEWLTERAEEANRAMNTPNVTDIFRIVKTSSQAVVGKGREVASRRAMSQQEAEAWKVHFENIQLGAGEIHPSVWEDVTDSTAKDSTQPTLPPGRNFTEFYGICT